MKKHDFEIFARGKIDQLLNEAREKFGKPISEEYRFRLSPKGPFQYKESSLQELIDYVYRSENEIYPFVDLLFEGVTSTTVPLITVIRSKYGPRPFGTNWTGQAGPFILMLGENYARNGELEGEE